MDKVGRRLAQVVAGVACGLLLVEAAFYLRDDGTFPHINCYLPDDVLGLRLEPGATQRISFAGNPAHAVRINARGLRGADLPDPAPGEVVVVGDSQVFGLGVEEDQTFSALLAERTGRPVINAGVPTYGPPEYAELARRLIDERKPETVVFTVNFVNDLFEWNAPNRARHAEWDGWAVRTETAPAEVVDFPGRRFLMRESHAVFAWRAFRAPKLPDPEGSTSFPSEGSWTDLVDPERLAELSGRRHPTMAGEVDPARVEQELEAIQDVLSEVVAQKQQRVTGQDNVDAQLLIQAAAGHPGDIVSRDYGEEAREVAVTARLMRQGAAYRDRVVQRLAELDGEVAEEVEAAVERDASLRSQRQAIANRVVNQRYDRSVLTPMLRELRDHCEERGVELVVVALPIDVQVSEEEWRKYPDATPIDMSSSMVLIEDLLDDARALGLRAVDTTEPLRAAEPGAFLYGDIHMTPKGHAAVADAVAEALDGPLPIARPRPGLPDGRTWVPRHQDWLRTPERTVKGSTKARCETVGIGEWLSVSCQRVDGRRPTGVTVHTGDRGEARITRTPDSVTLVTPLFRDEPLRATFHWARYGQVLTGTWTDTGEAVLAFGERDASLGAPLERSDAEQRLCRCAAEVRAEAVCEQNGDPLDPSGRSGFVTSYVHGCEDTCAHLSGGNLEACAATYPSSCADFLACAEGSLAALATCPADSIPVGGGGVCKPACDDQHPCADGKTCWPWQGSGYCG